ncbi:MAG: chemotaxis protein CheW [Acidobacteriales bacterium]|nr:chemotaxis protein CheW [Terriglobales bacterium]
MMASKNDVLCWREIGIEGDRSCPELRRHVHCRNCPEYSLLGRTLFDREMPANYRREISKDLAAAKAAHEEDAVSVLVFRLASEWFALRSVVFHEIAEDQPPYRLPYRCNGILAGLANVNGELLLYVSLERILEVDRAEASGAEGRPRLCVIGTGRERYVFRADEILGVRRVPAARLQTVPATLAKSPAAQTASCFEVDGRHVGLIYERKLFETLDGSLRW